MREQRRALVGTVVSDKMEKTIVVQVERVSRHPLYGKVMRSHKKYKVHDETNDARAGDTVQIRECRPISKDKTFYMETILERAVII
ncbi:MAG: 30S ribosomal protein S17 [Caldilineaceae bacterium]|nr:30S ribosomal protein S17 [Caldilineaceae bacterium]